MGSPGGVSRRLGSCCNIGICHAELTADVRYFLTASASRRNSPNIFTAKLPKAIASAELLKQIARVDQVPLQSIGAHLVKQSASV